MGKQDTGVRKLKGKKKFKNLIEKKAKGVKLSQIDRKRIVKVENQLIQKAELKKAVKSELDKFENAINDDDTRDSLCSESSFGSQPVKALPKKRVSFAGNLEKTKVFDKNVKDLDIKPSVASPGRGILRAKERKEKEKAAKKLEIFKAKIAAKAAAAASGELDTPADDKENKIGKSTEKVLKTDATSGTPIVAKKKVKLQVTKKIKEQLLNMPRKERKAFLRELKAQKNPLSDKIMEAKLLWEKVRCTKTAKLEKDDCIAKLVAIVKGHAVKFIYAHDTCRVIECLIALKRPGITSMLFNELTPEIVRMAKSKYARFFVTRMLNYGTKEQRDIIINAFNGHAVSLMRIVHAAEVLETAYNMFANAQQRFNIISEFYGREFVMFKTDKPRTLEEIVTEEPAKKKLILQQMEELLQVWVEKTTIRHSLTHRLLLDFLSNCDKDQFTNMVDSLKDKIPELVHTPEGAVVAMKCIWFSGAKERKMIVKNFKDLSVKAAMEHYGHRVLMAIFDSVDDTVLVNKYIVSELSNDVRKLLMDPWGEKVIHYLVHPRDGRGMMKGEIKQLEEGDTNPHSKKDRKDRYAALYRGVQEAIYPFLASNLEELIFEHNKAKWIVACLETTSQYDLFDRQVPAEMRQRCNEAFVELAKQEFIPMDSERFHLIEHPNSHFALMGVLRCDKDLPEDVRLSVALVNEVPARDLASWVACNKGCHVLLKMLQCGSEVVREKIQAAVSLKKLSEYTCKGAVLLLEELTKQ